MQYKELINKLKEVDQLIFKLPSGELVPSHFHITEAGATNKSFFDCGGKYRNEINFVFQLWVDKDIGHKLTPLKALGIMSYSENLMEGLQHREVIVEYQGKTKEIYNLDFDGESFLLLNTKTDCLAKDKCGIKLEKETVKSCNGGSCC